MEPLIQHEENNLREIDEAEADKISDLREKAKETITQLTRKFKNIINDDTKPLGERLRNLFKLKGLKIATNVTAVIIAISAIGGVIGRLFKPKPKPEPKPDPGPELKPGPNPPNKIVDGLNKFKNWLLSLGKKALVALPGILGGIFSTIFKAAASVVGVIAEHLIITLAVIILVVIQTLLNNKEIIKHKASKISLNK